MKVVCFYWQGDRWQEEGQPNEKPTDVSYQRHLQRVGVTTRGLVEDYVLNLYLSVLKWATEPFEFICFTNENLKVGIEGITFQPFPLITKKGVLPRMFMFSRESGLFGHQVLSLDLDIVITGSLQDIMGYKGDFCTRISWTRGEEHLIDGDIMSFRAGPENEERFWTPLVNNIEEVETITQGRERVWMRQQIGDKADIWSKVSPGQVCSYKHHVKPLGRLPENTRIVSCHGHPRPHQIEEQWRIENWR